LTPSTFSTSAQPSSKEQHFSTYKDDSESEDQGFDENYKLPPTNPM